MATKAPLGSLYAEGPEEQSLVNEIKDSYAKLRESLDSRQNQMFDPVLLAMSQGFLSPTKTGSFGEVLGNVAAQVGPAQQAEEKRSQEIASMKMELAQRELAQRQATRGEAMFREMLPRAGGQPAAPRRSSRFPRRSRRSRSLSGALDYTRGHCKACGRARDGKQSQDSE